MKSSTSIELTSKLITVFLIFKFLTKGLKNKLCKLKICDI